MKKIALLLFLSFSICLSASAYSNIKPNHPTKPHLDTATFATGCFWCTEAKFQQLRGVVKVVSGFSGGHVANPSYEQVCTGTTVQHYL